MTANARTNALHDRIYAFIYQVITNIIIIRKFARFSSDHFGEVFGMLCSENRISFHLPRRAWDSQIDRAG